MHSPVAHLASGTVQGSQCVNAPAFSFQGIPFAEPPLDKLRFFPPNPFNRTFDGGTLDATRQPHPCIQWTKSEFAVEDPTPSEDCLYLNVFVPKDKSKKLPVKVFAYGGSNIEGASNYPLYNGCNLADNAIVVTFNYRLGPLGFLRLQDAGIKGNMALQDYIAALQWVKSNINHFDGDPKQVMLFAQSAGAANAFAMSTMDNITAYVSAVVMESGGGQDVTPKETAQLAGESFSNTLNCSTSDINCIQSKSVDELVHAFHHAPVLLENGRSLGLEFGIHLPNRTNINSVILDGDIIKEQPLKIGSQVPIIAGSNSHDSSLFVLPNYSGVEVTNSTWQNFLKQWDTYADKVDEQYPLCGFHNNVLEAIVHVTTMSGFVCPTFKALRASKRPAFAYGFNHTPSCPWMWVKGKEFPRSNLFGPTHTSELPFTLANIDFQPETNGSCNGTKEEREISNFMVEAWTNMAVRSRPHDMWPEFNASNPQGLRVETKPSFGTLDFSECNFWDDIWAQMGGVNFSTPQGFNQSWPYDKSCQSQGHTRGIHWVLLIGSIMFISFLQI